MINGKRVAVVLPAYNAAKTLERCVRAIPAGFVDDTIVVDDASSDETVAVVRRLGLNLCQHPRNLGYGGNQKSCYRAALDRNADVIVMLHPDYQYDPRLLVAMAAPICYGVYDVMLGSRIIGGGALAGGMPLLKYVVNRGLTFFQNLLFRGSCRSITRGIAPTTGGCFSPCASTGIRTTSRSTPRCWRRSSPPGSVWARCRARRSTFPRPRRSDSGAACGTRGAVWWWPFNTPCT
jgi:glycosyltransferase involved in cell wall biosynthesis